MRIATKSSIIDTTSKRQLEEFAIKVGAKINQGDIFFLLGEMGVGKTSFVKYLINNLQKRFKEELTEVTSPTFNIMNEYKVKDLLIKHYDLYRIVSSDELKDLNLFDNRDNAILLIEWPEIIEKKPNSFIKFHFEYKNDYKNRSIKIIN